MTGPFNTAQEILNMPDGDLVPGRTKEESCALDKVVKWSIDFLCNPNVELGRSGPVCPYVKLSIDKNLFFLAIEHMATANIDEVQSKVMPYRDIFLTMEPIYGDDSMFKTILVLFPEVTIEDAPTVIDGLQKSLKPSFVKIGLMIGEFHDKNDSPGLRNARFRPLRAPIPMLAIRHMVPTDLPFLVDNVSQVRFYLDRFGEEGQTRLMAYLAQYSDGPRQETYHVLVDELNRAQGRQS